MNLVKQSIPAKDMERIASAIGAAESTTSGEIRVEVRQRRSRRERSQSVEALARRTFIELGMTNTRDKTGVLLFLLLEDRQFCIFADEGIHAKVDPAVWTEVAGRLSTELRAGRLADGIIGAVKEVGGILTKHVPRRAGDTNELPNTVSTR